MELVKIYKEVLDLFPDTISIDDGMLIKETNGFLSSNLSAAWDVAQNKASGKGEWHELMVWIMYQVLHQNAKYLFEQKVYELKKDIDILRFKKLLINNLKTEGYDDMYQDFCVSNFP